MSNIPGPFDGRYLVLAFCADPSFMRLEEHCDRFLSELVGRLGMRTLGVHTYDVVTEVEQLNQEVFEDEGGVTGVAVLSTSHIAVHFWPERREGVLSVYSCRPFDREVVLRLLSTWYSSYDVVAKVDTTLR